MLFSCRTLSLDLTTQCRERPFTKGHQELGKQPQADHPIQQGPGGGGSQAQGTALGGVSGVRVIGVAEMRPERGQLISPSAPSTQAEPSPNRKRRPVSPCR